MNFICVKCQRDLPSSAFRALTNKKYRRTCKKCSSKIAYEKFKVKLATDSEFASDYQSYRREQSNKQKQDRLVGDNVDLWIFWDSRSSDKKRGLENDLDRDFIKKEIAKGCSYCGSHDLRMGLDRKDNTLGHLKSNVVPCCTRCNYIRRDMPYQAWLKLVPTVKSLVQDGSFDDWHTQPWMMKRKKEKMVPVAGIEPTTS